VSRIKFLAIGIAPPSGLRLTGTSAMTAKVARHPWSIEELYEKVMATIEA
jgi:hypothetical protein